jgi:hypothetical protein
MRHLALSLLVFMLATSAASAAEAPSAATGLDWELILKALGAIISVLLAYVQFRGLNLTSRATLKTDLEILKLLDAGNPNYPVVKQSIDQRLALLYAEPPAQTKRYIGERIGIAALGLVVALGFSYWTFKLVEPGFTWWSLLTGYLALAGVIWMIMGATGKGIVQAHAQRREAQQQVEANKAAEAEEGG